GDVASPDRLLERWVSMGYIVEPTVEVPGTASRRGGILDVFPVSQDSPVRIEFFGDEIESIRVFDPESQRSVEPAEVVTITPADETLPLLADRETARNATAGLDFRNCSQEAQGRVSEELGQLLNGEMRDDLAFYGGFLNTGTLFDYAPATSLLLIVRPSAVEEAARSSDRRVQQIRESKENRGEIPQNFPGGHIDWGQLSDSLYRRHRCATLSPWGVEDEESKEAVERLPFEAPPVTGGDTATALRQAEERRRLGYRVVVLSQHAARLAEMAADLGISATQLAALEAPPEPGTLTFTQGRLREGFEMSPVGESPLLVLTDREMFGVSKERRRVRKRPVRYGAKLSDLQPGAYVVHVEHGVGKFLGTQTSEQDGREYLIVEYAEDDRLFVPTEHVDRLNLYRSATEAPPRLTRLGTQEWTRAKARAKRAAEQVAADLISVYAAREVTPGLASVGDTPWQDQLEASFPYEETRDQTAAIQDVKKDLETPTPMDRLVCGDVGYGKTEVALRAAFKVVESGRQVAVLVPTTVLAQQHFDTFSERMNAFPVTVEMLSRFRSESEQQDIVKRVAAGEVDVCIGTHRMLQRDVRFKNLGMVVVDEEQRFGVAHKERLKRLRNELDVLAMSATPIPRTLHMSLSGIRDMSTMETPPEERLPIKTYVSEESDELVREAILREMDRGGQVFFLHNRVKNIDYVAHKLQELVPEARICVGHGQMGEHQLEQVMAEFGEHEYDVLVCTTIIESGLDLANVNTLIVNRADMFGLAQLYQLRGRVGRGTNRAYAYFLVPRGKQLTEEAEQRLNTIRAATELGAGLQIAMRDLEIRGAGNLLGDEQSGHIAAIGFDLYTNLLARAVEALKAEQAGREKPAEEPEFKDLRVDLGLEALIPTFYVEDLPERLQIYQRVARLESLDEVDDLADELRDRFGDLPYQAQMLLYTARVRILADQAGIDSVVAKDSRATLSLREPTGGARQPLQKILGRGVNVGHMQIRMEIDREDPDWQEELVWVLEQVRDFRQRFLETLAEAGSPAGVGG
ncbi:MAG: transcription-repair coupling factor, partial [Chloroflexota bacterium]